MAKKLTKKQKRNRLQLIFGLVASILVFGLGYLFGTDQIQGVDDLWNTIQQKAQQVRPSINGNQEDFFAKVTVFDVGQGSSALYQSGDGSNILIDSGRYDDSDQQIISYLDQTVGIGNSIDLVIFTHNDADHIGHGDLIFEYFDVQEVWLNGLDHTTATYESLLDAILDSEAQYEEPKSGYQTEVGYFTIDVLHPQKNPLTNDQNEESIVTHMKVGDFSMMSTGDVSYEIEDLLIHQNHDLQSDILLLGHHGSQYSTGRDWIDSLSPKLAIYSAGQGNSYGHPHTKTIHRLKESQIPYYGTIENGTISILIEENGNFQVELEHSGE